MTKYSFVVSKEEHQQPEATFNLRITDEGFELKNGSRTLLLATNIRENGKIYIWKKCNSVDGHFNKMSDSFLGDVWDVYEFTKEQD